MRKKMKEITEELSHTYKGVVSDLEVARKMINLKQSADSRGIKFDLSFMTLKKLLEQKKCFYTGREFDEKGDFSLSIDRIDSRDGYVEGNVVSCTVEINRKKTDITPDEIEMLYRAIKRTKKGSSEFTEEPQKTQKE